MGGRIPSPTRQVGLHSGVAKPCVSVKAPSAAHSRAAGSEGALLSPFSLAPREKVADRSDEDLSGAQRSRKAPNSDRFPLQHHFNDAIRIRVSHVLTAIARQYIEGLFLGRDAEQMLLAANE